MDNKIARDYAMSKEDVFNLIEETIKRYYVALAQEKNSKIY